MKSSTLQHVAAALSAVAGVLFPGAVHAAQGDAVGPGLATVFKDGVGYDSKKLIASVRGIVGRE